MTGFLTKADLIAGLGSVANGTAAHVLFDETKGGTLSYYLKRYNALEYQYSLPVGTDESEAATGIFFDTAAGDEFTDLIVPSDASLTVNAGSIAFSSASAVTLDALVKGTDGNPLKFCFDDMIIDMTVEVHSYPANGAEGVMAAMVNETLGLYGGAVSAHGGSTTQILPKIMGVNSTRATATPGHAFTDPYTVRMRYIREGATAKAVWNYDGGSDNELSYTMVFAATSFELPRMFSTAGLRFRQGDITVTGLKVSAGFPNARFAFLGDSLTQGRTASAYADGFAAKVRADYPDDVLIAGAPSAKTGDWLAHLEPMFKMKPAYCYVLLGTNDVLNGVSLSTFQTNYPAIMGALIAHDIVPIAITIPPNGSAATATWNAWIMAQGWRCVDVYPALLGTGYDLDPAFDSGDHIHPRSAGHEVIYELVAEEAAAL